MRNNTRRAGRVLATIVVGVSALVASQPAASAQVPDGLTEFAIEEGLTGLSPASLGPIGGYER